MEQMDDDLMAVPKAEEEAAAVAVEDADDS